MVKGKAKRCGFNKARPGEKQELCEEPGQATTGYCVFHTPIDEGKPNFWLKFKDYYDKTVIEYEKAPEVLKDEVNLDCRGFVFPDMNEGVFSGEIPFNVDFSGAQFSGKAIFYGLIFRKKANFEDAEFKGSSYFGGTEFKNRALFNSAKFRGRVSFFSTDFSEDGDFGLAKFGNEVSFHEAIFQKRALFGMIKFHGPVSFEETEFGGQTLFLGTKFFNTVSFVSANFLGDVNFEDSVFEGYLEFGDIIFGVDMNFQKTYFKEGAYFAGPNFEYEEHGNINFTRVSTAKDAEFIFELVDLANWAFADTEAIESASFIDVSWRGTGKPKRKHTRDELEAIQTKGRSPTFEGAAAVYRRLRLNFESRLAYEAASDFHIGQMEMLLLNPSTSKPKRFFLWWYKWISNFGESVGRPLIWFAGLWATFFAIWLVLPARHEFAGVFNILKLNFDWPWEWLSKTRFPDITDFGWYIWRKFWLTASNFITFPKPEGTYFERFLGGLQRFLGVTIVTFFILALRRAFRR